MKCISDTWNRNRNKNESYRLWNKVCRININNKRNSKRNKRRLPLTKTKTPKNVG